MEKTFRTPTAFRCRLTELGFDVTLRFQTVKRGIDGANGHFTPSPRFDLLPRRNPIGSISKTKKRQDYDVLEFSEIIAIWH